MNQRPNYRVTLRGRDRDARWSDDCATWTRTKVFASTPGQADRRAFDQVIGGEYEEGAIAGREYLPTRDEVIASIRDTAERHCDVHHRFLNEAREAGIHPTGAERDWRYTASEKVMTHGVMKGLRLSLLRWIRTGEFDTDWWVGIGGSWGEQVFGDAREEDYSRADHAEAEAIEKTAMRPLHEAWRAEWFADRDRARAAIDRDRKDRDLRLAYSTSTR